MRSLLATAALGLLLASCASIGRPEGGPRDEMPPEFVSSNPAPGAVNVTPRRMHVTFNENIQLEDAFNKVVASPPGKQVPTVRANGRHLTVEFRDTLIPNTTYTIDFADAIKDLNEGNILDGFALDFSTGPTIDTLRISGMVLDARTLEPQQGMLVGIHSNLSDTALTKLPFARIARTNQLGQFTVRGLAPGEYRVYAVKDVNNDYKWDRSEEMAFYDISVSPSIENIEVVDTLRDVAGGDSLVARPGLHYVPDDILLNSFSEGYKPQYLKDYTRPERRKINIGLSAPADSLAELTIVDGVADSLRGLSWKKWALMHSNATRDTLDYWITDSAVIMSDSLRLSLRYQKTDTAEQLVWTTDTLRFFFRAPRQDKKKAEADTLPPRYDLLSLRLVASQQELNRPFIFEAAEPIASIDSAGIALEIKRDTLWIPVADGRALLSDSLQPLMRRKFDVKWEGGERYRLRIDSAAIRSVYGIHNPAFDQEFNVKGRDEYSSILFHLQGLDGRAAAVELLGTDDKPKYISRVDSGAVEAQFDFVAPGTYYARLFIDANANGQWDPGNFALGLQPEETFYFDKKLELKKNWDVDQNWDIYGLAVDSQKPYAIKKNKPKLKRGEKAPDSDSGDGFDSENEQYNPFGGSGGRGNNRPGGNNSNRRPGMQANPGNQLLRR